MSSRRFDGSRGGSGRFGNSAKAKKESERLAEEALKMEARLRVLRTQMTAEKEKWDSDRPKKGGSRWRSSRTDRGSIRKYGKDVLDRKPTKGTRRRPDARSGTSSAAQPPSAPQDRARRARPASGKKLRQADAETWQVADVTRWLSVLGLAQYQQLFAENEITGSVLLELTSEDLDFMSIKVLGHRKMLLKGVEQLNYAVRGTQPPPVAAASVAASASTAQEKAVHWSHVKPLSETEVSNQPSTLADGVLDEAAERAAFQAAVMAWRTGGDAAAPAPAPAPAAAAAAAGATAEPPGGLDILGEWQNPFGGAGAGSGAPAATTTAAGTEPPVGGGGALLNGALDEEAEHVAFKRAVEAWRKTGANDADPPSKTSCYQCYRLFYVDPAHAIGKDGHNFCKVECADAYSARMQALKAKQASAAAEAEKLRQDAASAAARASEMNMSRVGSPLDVQALDNVADAVKPTPRKDYSSIWSMDINY